MTAFDSKSIFLWPGSGDHSLTAGLLVDAGFQTVILHSTSAAYWRIQFSRAEAETYKAAGLKVIGSCAVYGNDAGYEGTLSAQLAKEYEMAGWIFDAEATFEQQANANSNAVKLLQHYRASAGDLQAAWCSWARFKSPVTGSPWHPVDVMRAAMTLCDYGMPMCYWTDGSDAQAAELILNQALEQWDYYTDKPLIPIGRAYNGDGQIATPEAVTAFAARADKFSVTGLSWWVADQAIKLSAVWQALANTPQFGVVEPEPEPEPTGIPLTVRQSSINIRTQPTITSAIVGVLAFGERVAVTEMHEAEGYQWGKHSRGWSVVDTGNWWMEPTQ
jgi:hypothetical protein